MPPFQPNATVPVPAPIAPSSTAPSRAEAIAAVTWSRVTCRPRMSFRPPSLVSPTSALTDRTFSLPGCASVHLTTASTATPTPSVLVSTIGDSIVPSSCTCVEPANLPKALPTNTAPGTFSRNRLPPCGTIAVTPVRTVSPAMRVVCPTRTPATSVMAFSGPGLPSPGVIPRSRARGRPWAVIASVARRATAAKTTIRAIDQARRRFVSI